MLITMTPIRKRQRARFYINKKQNKLRNGYIYIFKKEDTFQKARQLFELRFYTQFSWNF